MRTGGKLYCRRHKYMVNKRELGRFRVDGHVPICREFTVPMACQASAARHVGAAGTGVSEGIALLVYER